MSKISSNFESHLKIAAGKQGPITYLVALLIDRIAFIICILAIAQSDFRNVLLSLAFKVFGL